MTQDEIETGVTKEYENTLIVPPEPSRKLFILCPVGIIGAGKTTVTKPLSELLSLVRICPDEIRRLLKERKTEFDPLDRTISSNLAKKYLSKGHSIALDSDTASPRSRKLIEEGQREFGALAIWIHINPPEEFILNKLRTYKHTWLFKDGEHAVENYMKRKPLHEHLDMPFVYTFDTSRDDLERQINEAANTIRKLVEL